VKPWQMDGVEGVHRFLGRVWRMVANNMSLIEGTTAFAGNHADINHELAKKLRTKTHQTIKKVSAELEDLRFNTCISSLMELLNEIYLYKIELNDGIGRAVLRESVEHLLKLLSPFAPHIAEELWELLGQKQILALETWPTYDASASELDTVTIVVQVNGKLRANFAVDKSISDEDLKQIALKEPKLEPFLKDKQIVKVIVVPHKLVNFVVKG